MAIPVTTVEHKAVGSSTWTTLSNVQAVELNKGRRKISDGVRPGTVVIEGRRPDLLPQINIADIIRVTLVANGVTQQWSFRVSDAQINYQIASSADTWSIDGEDALALLGRATYTSTWTTSQSAKARAEQVCIQAGSGLVQITPMWVSTPTSASQTFTDAQALDVFQRLVNTEQAFVDATESLILWSNRGWQYSLSSYYLTDDGTGTTPGTYQEIEFRSMADNYADYVIAQNDTLSVVDGTGDYSYFLPTLAFDSATLAQLAAWTRQLFSVQKQTPTRVSVLLNSQTTAAAINLLQGLTQAIIKLRGTVYWCVIEGYTVSIQPDQTRINFYLSDSSFFKFLVLNDAVYGTLDYNKLGF